MLCIAGEKMTVLPSLSTDSALLLRNIRHFLHACLILQTLHLQITLNSQVHPPSLNGATHMQKDWQYHALKRGRK